MITLTTPRVFSDNSFPRRIAKVSLLLLMQAEKSQTEEFEG